MFVFIYHRFGIKCMQGVMLKQFFNKEHADKSANLKGPMAPHTNNMMQIIATTTSSFYFASIAVEVKKNEKLKIGKIENAHRKWGSKESMN